MNLREPRAWRPTVALVNAAVLGVSCLLLAVLLRRPDLVVIAAPLLGAPILAFLRAPAEHDAGSVTLDLPVGAVWEDEDVPARIEVRSDAPIDLALLELGHDPRVVVDPPRSAFCVRPAPEADVELTLRPTRWGRARVGPVSATYTAGHGLLRRRVGLDAPPGRLITLPLRAAFRATDIVPAASGLVGAHRSRRPGTGTDLLAVRPFAPGDRLRRITWPVSLRTGQLHVITTSDDRDTGIVLLLDSGADVADGAALDVAVRAVAAVAEHYLRQGDRVGLIDLGAALRPVRLAAGRRHLLLLLDVLLDSTLRPLDHTHIGRVLHEVPPRTLVIVFSALLDDTIEQHLAAIAQAGHTLLVVDTLPADAHPTEKGEWAGVAWRIVLLQRDTLSKRLVHNGIPVLPWRGPGSLDDVLVRLARTPTPIRSRG
ncbi:MAG TPA: DUF58 domain-containing protein [Jatrophihabitantaceae bacterium]